MACRAAAALAGCGGPPTVLMKALLHLHTLAAALFALTVLSSGRQVHAFSFMYLSVCSSGWVLPCLIALVRMGVGCAVAMARTVV